MNAKELSEKSIVFRDFVSDSMEDEDVLDQFAEHLEFICEVSELSYDDILDEWNRWV